MKTFSVLVIVACLVFIQNVISDEYVTEEGVGDVVLPPTADDYNYDDRKIDDLEPAESMVFRPMFAYKKMMERRKKWQQDNYRRRNPYHY